MKKNILKQFTIIGTGTFISMLLGLFNAPIITRLVSPESYGQYSTFLMYGNLAGSILYLGLDQSLIRYFYESKETNYIRKLLYKCIKTPLILISILSLILIGLEVTGVITFELGTMALFLLVIYVFIITLNRFSNLLVRLQFKSKMFASLNIIQKLTYLMIVLSLVYFKVTTDTQALIIATVLSYLIIMLVSVISERKFWKFNAIKTYEIDITNKQLLSYSLPFVLSMGITSLFNANDKLFLNYFWDYKELGIYTSAVSLISIFSIIQTTFNTIWAPASIEHFKRDHTDTTFYQQGNKIITVLMFTAGLTVVLLKDVFAILLGSQYREAANVLPLLIFGPILYTISETTVVGIVFKEKSKYQVIVAVGAFLVDIVGKFILVPSLGGKGAAISSAISYVVFFSLRTYFSNKLFYIDFSLHKIYTLIFITAIFSVYSMFVPFNIITVCGYIFALICVVIIYKNTFKFMVDYIVSLIKKKQQKI
ncbi:lipopolysaccharide biosynthesis protein [Fundicoccus sp. Sow4_F4]|uniref:lipopolysaccharide biosynthesis protein n=1 Tax=Fundicoccus sp. Sow4_F4 TaxID=3438783 RepID=UPI003F91AB24